MLFLLRVNCFLFFVFCFKHCLDYHKPLVNSYSAEKKLILAVFVSVLVAFWGAGLQRFSLCHFGSTSFQSLIQPLIVFPSLIHFYWIPGTLIPWLTYLNAQLFANCYFPFLPGAHSLICHINWNPLFFP